MKDINLGSKNGNWVDNPTYIALHSYIRRKIIKPKKCPKCNKYRKLQLSCKGHKYTRDLKQWEYLCQSCHKIKDKQIGRKQYFCKICSKLISYTSGKFGRGRCGSCAKSIDQKDKRRE